MDEGTADTGSTQSATSAPATEAAAANGSGAASTPEWWNGLQGEGNRATAEAKSWQSPDDVIRSYRGLEGKLGQTLTVPSDDAKPEDWGKFYGRLGRPEKPDGYEFKLPEGIPEDFAYNKDDATKFKNWAHETGLSPKQAQRLHDDFVKDMAGQRQGALEQRAKAADAAHKELVTVWGDPSSESYKRNQELANRAIRQQGGSQLMAEMRSLGALDGNIIVAPKLAQMLAKVGKDLYAEDSLFAGPESQVNPFSPKSENLTEQGRIIRSDPSRARQMIISAGVDPKEYGLEAKA